MTTKADRCHCGESAGELIERAGCWISHHYARELNMVKSASTEAAKRHPAKRELLAPRSDKRYIRRTRAGALGKATT